MLDSAGEWANPNALNIHRIPLQLKSRELIDCRIGKRNNRDSFAR